MARINSLLTPACLINDMLLSANAKRMSDKCERDGVALRPHVKTLKSLEAAQLYAPLNMPITVSTLAEAKYFASAGYQDILYAVGITPNKLSAVNSILQQNVVLTVVLDSLVAVEALVKAAGVLESPLRIAIEIDVDGQRAGIAFDSPHLINCAETIFTHQCLQFAGIVAHAGASYGCFNQSERDQMAQQECDRAVAAAAELAAHGYRCEMVSVGSTPTALATASRSGITEIRAGVYATFDCVMAGLGVCDREDIAMSVVTTVIGHQVEKNWVLVDAGWMALSRDQGTANHPLDCGYGLVCDLEGIVLDGWYVFQTNQEHGVIKHRDGLEPPDHLFSYGTMLRILPVHACATAAQFDRYHVTNDNRNVTAIWNRINGW